MAVCCKKIKLYVRMSGTPMLSSANWYIFITREIRLYIARTVEDAGPYKQHIQNRFDFDCANVQISQNARSNRRDRRPRRSFSFYSLSYIFIIFGKNRSKN